MTLRRHPDVTVHEEQRLHEGRRISLIRQRLELPSGLQQDLDLVEHPGAVGIAAFDPDGRMLLVRQYRAAIGDWALEIPAGALEVGEDPGLAAAREFEEETGYRADSLTPWHSIYPAPGFASEVIHIFRADTVRAIPGGGPACDEDEELDVVWLDPEDVLGIQPLDAKTMIAALLAKKA